MSQKRARERRAILQLAGRAHGAIHLLLGLADAVTDSAVAAECKKHADSLSAALRRALRLLGDS
jgi:hypothetical protein